MRLYDGRLRNWDYVVVDDRVPVKEDGSPYFGKPNGNEMWAVILEKAFAKWCGSYAALSGGFGVWAWEALTGDAVFRLELDTKEGTWERWDLVHPKEGAARRAVRFRATGEKHNDIKTYRLVKRYIERGALVAASISNAGEAKRSDGLVAGHLYSVLDVRTQGWIVRGLGLLGV